MAFIQDPRLRQRWNQISHNAEAATENAAAGIWTFQHRYISPCLGVLGSSLDSCTSLCLGDREERARRARERDRGARRTRAEYTFDFYDDWEDADDEGVGRGLLGGWGGVGRGEDWDRLLAGTGSTASGGGGGGGGGGASDDVIDGQPRRKRGMSYGTRGAGPRRKAPTAEEDPNVIPRTAPIGFLGWLPFKVGGTLRYKPSAANLRDHPGGGGGSVPDLHGGEEENEPLLGASDDEDNDYDEDGVHRKKKRSQQSRPRSNTAESGDTSSSYRSRGDLFPSDGEGDEDAVPLDDEFAVALDRVGGDDRSSNKTRSSKGKRPDRDRDRGMSRTVSRTTMSSGYTTHTTNTHTPDSYKEPLSSSTILFPTVGEEIKPATSLEDLQREEEQAEREEYEEIERRRKAASQLALQRGLSKDNLVTEAALCDEAKDKVLAEENEDETPEERMPNHILPPAHAIDDGLKEAKFTSTVAEEPSAIIKAGTADDDDDGQFVPARLPQFG